MYLREKLIHHYGQRSQFQCCKTGYGIEKQGLSDNFFGICSITIGLVQHVSSTHRWICEKSA